MQGVAQQALQAKIALAHAVVRAVRLAVERLQQRDGELGDGLAELLSP